MIKEIIHIATSKSIVQDGMNCLLSYTMAQPVNIDVRVLILFLIQYIGMTQTAELLRKLSSHDLLSSQHSENQETCC